MLTAPTVSISTPSIEIKVEPQLQTVMETNEEEDSVFNDHPSIKPDPDQKSGTPAQHQERERPSSIRASKNTAGSAVPLRNGEPPSISTEIREERASFFSWCNHHHSLMLHLSSIIQTIAVQCPTAFVNSKVKSSSKESGKL